MGELLRAALDDGARRIVLGIGGSATNDGGAGMLQALGVRLLDADGAELPPGGAALARLDRVDVSGLDPRIRDVELVVASDVDNPLVGPDGAAAVFGPQKGASPADVAVLDAALTRYAAVLARDLGVDVAALPGAGGAGGTAAGAVAVLGARVVSGARAGLRPRRAWTRPWTAPRWRSPGRVPSTSRRCTARGRRRWRRAPGGPASRAWGWPASCGSRPSSSRRPGSSRAAALTDVEPDLARCLAEPGQILARLAADVVPPLVR